MGNCVFVANGGSDNCRFAKGGNSTGGVGDLLRGKGAMLVVDDDHVNARQSNGLSCPRVGGLQENQTHNLPVFEFPFYFTVSHHVVCVASSNDAR